MARWSGLVLLAIVLLTAIAAAVSSQWLIARDGARSSFQFRHGLVFFTWNPGSSEWDWAWNGWHTWPAGSDWRWGRMMSRPRSNTNGGWRSVSLPLGPPLAVGASCSAALFILGRTPRRRPGACAHCGYDLLGLPATTPACPECGGKIPREA